MTRALCFAGLVGSAYWLVLQTVLNPNAWGTPGSSAYASYETWNRLWPLGLLLMGLGFSGLYILVRELANRLVRIGAWLTFIGFALMIVGNAAEFWLFSDQAYGEMNGRNLSYFFGFFIGMLLMLVGNVLIGIGAWRAHVLPIWLCILLIAHLPLAFVAMINQVLIGPTPLVVAVVCGWVLLMLGRDASFDKLRRRVSTTN